MTEPSAFALSVAGLATGLACLIGLPLAWLLGRHAFRGKSPLQALLLLPLVLPATLLGYCVVLLGQQPAVARGLALVGLVPAFDWRMGILIATTGALAMFVRSAQAEFARVDRRLEQAARTLGRSEWSLFWAVTLPLAWRGWPPGWGWHLPGRSAKSRSPCWWRGWLPRRRRPARWGWWPSPARCCSSSRPPASPAR